MSLHEAFTTILDGTPGTWTAYARHLGTDETIHYNQGAVQPTASAAKNFLLLDYVDRCARGTLDSKTRHALAAEDHTLGSGVLRFLDAGLQPTLDDYAWLMIIVSDNLATNVLLDALGGPEAVNACLDRYGISDGRIHEPITFREVALAWATATARALAESFTPYAQPADSGLGAGAAEHARRILVRQQFTASLPRYLPSTHHAVDFGFDFPCVVYNKTGSVPGVTVDAGLVETVDAQWVVAVLGESIPLAQYGEDDPGPTAIARVGMATWDAWGTPR